MKNLKSLFSLSRFYTIDLDKESSSYIDKLFSADKIKNNSTVRWFNDIIDSNQKFVKFTSNQNFVRFDLSKSASNSVNGFFLGKNRKTLRQRFQGWKHDFKELFKKFKSNKEEDTTKKSSPNIWGWVLAIGAGIYAFYSLVKDRLSFLEKDVPTQDSPNDLPDMSFITDKLPIILEILPKIISTFKDTHSTATVTSIVPERTVRSTYIPESTSSKVVSPLGGALIITSDFGARDIDIGSKDHDGIDLRAPIGTPVYASENGQVVDVRTQSPKSNTATAGHYLIVRYPQQDGSDFVMTYMHLSDTVVHKGDIVKAGQVIAHTGNSGKPLNKSMSPHLHFRVHINGNKVDPKDYFDSRGFNYSYSSTCSNKKSNHTIKSTSTKTNNTARSNFVEQPQQVQHVNANPINKVTPSDIKLSTKAKNKKYNLYGLSYSDKHGSRPSKYSNPANVRPSNKHEGQTGVEATESSGKFAVFSDPFYSIKALVASTILAKPASDTYWTGEPYKQIVDINFKFHVATPKAGKNLYNIMSHLSPANERNNPETYATRIVNKNTSAFPQGIHSTVCLEKSKAQFISFIQAVLATEQGTSVDDWYLDMCWEAIYNNGPVPLQSFLADLSNNSSKTLSSSASSGSVSIIHGNQQRPKSSNSQR